MATAAELITPTARLLAPAEITREEWLTVRQQGIGGSDVAAILGMDRHRGPLHVYRDKRGLPTGPRSARLDRSARRGHRMEGLIAEFFAEETGHAVVESPGTFQHADHPWMLANPDRIVFEEHADLLHGRILECKSRTWRSARREEWGGDEPPDGPALQAHWYMAVTGYEAAYLAGLVDDDFRWFRLERDEELIGHLVQLVGEFWHDHVLAGVEPDPGDLASTDELLSQMWDVKPESIKLFSPAEAAEADALIARRDDLKRQIADLARDLGAVENKLKANLGDAEIAIAPGRELYSWKRNGNFAPKRFREARPDLAAEYRTRVPALDLDALKTHHPDVYAAFRARVLRTPGSPE